ncbi:MULTISPECIES: EutP/PduV family microcompartment system protein [Eubacterium]|uniref:Ethanolamine utilization protein EutP n=1 Tax=Eubacterium barkeri TaxID=1528 RepID=A0A1H3CYT5_EUBBA|nr:EutP/PduV family microcompartment system protein [Eubacterium barkeri]SDX58704.1 ethanolamine utilization protein EutP [Eubacterium barkeri]
MKKMVLIGRSECGKTTLKQALKGKKIQYEKTQYINYFDVIIDTPGEYAENASLARALALYAYESDVVALLISATEPYSLYPPAIDGVSTRPIIGIVTQIDSPYANTEQAIRWLELTGANPIFPISSYTGEGLWDLLTYLREPGDEFPFTRAELETPREVLSTKYEPPAIGEAIEDISDESSFLDINDRMII